MDFLPASTLGWIAALAAGLLIGIERERSHPDEQAPAGVRSFALAALAGAVAASLGPAAEVVALAAVGALSVAGYLRTRDVDPGLTTELALVLTLLLGELAMRAPALAAGLAVLTVALLAAKARLHGFVRRVLSEQELQHGVLLLASALVVLPLLPDREFALLGGLNLHTLWALAVLMMGVQTAGHIALRWLGPAHALALTGLLGGFVSSTATIAAMARRAREQPRWLDACLAGAMFSNIATVLQLGGIVLVVAPGLLMHLGPALLLAGIAALATGAGSAWRARRDAASERPAWDLAGPPFSARAALLFAALVSLMLVGARAVERAFGGGAVLGAAALAGLADAHAVSASAAQLFAAGKLSAPWAAWSVGAAFASNAVSKTVAALAGRQRRFALMLGLAQALVVAAFGAGLALSAGVWTP